MKLHYVIGYDVHFTCSSQIVIVKMDDSTSKIIGVSVWTPPKIKFDAKALVAAPITVS